MSKKAGLIIPLDTHSADDALRQARQTVHHSKAHPSHLLLPVIPAS